MIAVDLDDPVSFVPWLEDAQLIDHLVWAASSRLVTDVWVAGRQVVDGGHCTTVDVERARHEVGVRARSVPAGFRPTATTGHQRPPTATSLCRRGRETDAPGQRGRVPGASGPEWGTQPHSTGVAPSTIRLGSSDPLALLVSCDPIFLVLLATGCQERDLARRGGGAGPGVGGGTSIQPARPPRIHRPVVALCSPLSQPLRAACRRRPPPPRRSG